jgi:hypothetical protein
MEDLAGLRATDGCINVAAPRGAAVGAEEATIGLQSNRPETSEASPIWAGLCCKWT